MGIYIHNLSEKEYKQNLKIICCQYRSGGCAPEDAIPYMIDLWATTFEVDALNKAKSTGEMPPSLKEIQAGMRWIVEAFVHPAAYGMRSESADGYWEKLSESYGILLGLADACRKVLYMQGDLRQSRKTWVIAEMLRQEVIQHSASTQQSITEITLNQAV